MRDAKGSFLFANICIIRRKSSMMVARRTSHRGLVISNIAYSCFGGFIRRFGAWIRCIDSIQKYSHCKREVGDSSTKLGALWCRKISNLTTVIALASSTPSGKEGSATETFAIPSSLRCCHQPCSEYSLCLLKSTLLHRNQSIFIPFIP